MAPCTHSTSLHCIQTSTNWHKIYHISTSSDTVRLIWKWRLWLTVSQETHLSLLQFLIRKLTFDLLFLQRFFIIICQFCFSFKKIKQNKTNAFLSCSSFLEQKKVWQLEMIGYKKDLFAFVWTIFLPPISLALGCLLVSAWTDRLVFKTFLVRAKSVQKEGSLEFEIRVQILAGQTIQQLSLLQTVCNTDNTQ